MGHNGTASLYDGAYEKAPTINMYATKNKEKPSMPNLEGEGRPRQKDLAVPQIRLSKVELLFE